MEKVSYRGTLKHGFFFKRVLIVVKLIKPSFRIAHEFPKILGSHISKVLKYCLSAISLISPPKIRCREENRPQEESEKQGV